MAESSIRDRATRQHGSPTAAKPSNGRGKERPDESVQQTSASPSGNTHRRFVLTDPVALKYLQEDPSTTVLGSPQRLEGYECYIVEQWACARTHPTFIITTFTGDRSHSVVASVLIVPNDEDLWSPRLKVYFNALYNNLATTKHATRRETALGTLMVTKISAFPSSLTVIPVPDGDVKKHREDFVVNENLKRLGCFGRVGISLSKPTAATQAKFYQLYRTSEKIDLYKAVIELVKLCQVALTLFDLLGPEYADGLLCDVTEKAINNWWTEIGNDLYNVEPHDGVLGPTTVAAILGTLIGARNRLSASGAQTSKDVFDVEATKRAIAYFQKSQRLPKTRRLDRTTLKRLHGATAKAATNEGWKVPRVMKSTVAELGGKGGEMVMEMVGAKEKAGIADVETVDIEQFVQLVSGERARWLWYGKPGKNQPGDMIQHCPGTGPEGGNMEFRSDEHGGHTWQGTRQESFPIETQSPIDGLGTPFETSRRSHELGEEVRGHQHRLMKRQTNRDDGKRFSKVRNVVSLYSHHKHAKEDVVEDGVPPPSAVEESSSRWGACPKNAPTSQSTHDSDGHGLEKASVNNDNGDGLQTATEFSEFPTETPLETTASVFAPRPPSVRDETMTADAISLEPPFTYDTQSPTGTTPTGSSVAGSIDRGTDFNDVLPAPLFTEQAHRLLRRRSDGDLGGSLDMDRHPARWPRNLSFSVAEDSIFTWNTSSWDLGLDAPDTSTESPTLHFAKQQLIAEECRHAREKLARVDRVSNWVDAVIGQIKHLEELYNQDIEEVDNMYALRWEAYQRLRVDGREALAGEKSVLTGMLKDDEVLGAKLEYEINALRSKVEDVEDGVEEFARQVGSVESMVGELEERYIGPTGGGSTGWLGWLWTKASTLERRWPS